MKATCPHCGTTYRIDPRKVPAGGVQARCSRCGGVFEVRAAVDAVAPPAVPAAPAAAQSAAPPVAAEAESGIGTEYGVRDIPAIPTSYPRGDVDGQVDLPTLTPPPPRAQPAVAQPPAAPPPPPPAAAPPATPATPPPAAPAPERPAVAPPPPPPLFGRPDPHGKARRLARALISDIAVYHPERRDRGLADGTLRQEFREEIRKSWDEYVSQVGDSIARGTPYFREALNDILAGGRTVF